MNKELFFLCNFVENLCFVLAVKSEDGDWHHFEDEDTLISAHGSLPANLETKIKQLQRMTSVPISLDSQDVMVYMIDDKFVFKGKELKTYVQISSDRLAHFQRRRKPSSTSDLVFIAGETNPLIFLSELEKCSDVKADKDKLYNIRKFVNDEHKMEFSNYFFKGQWEAARQAFLKKYSFMFTENKKKTLDFQFGKETGLRSFVHNKIIALSKFTTLTLNNQMEVILAELPIEISNLFVLQLKINPTANEILEFCDAIQELNDDGMSSGASGNTTPTPQSQQHEQSEVVQDVEIFSYSSDTQSEIESSEGQSSNSSVSRKRGKGNGRGRPSKISKVTNEDSEASGSSTSSFSYQK